MKIDFREWGRREGNGVGDLQDFFFLMKVCNFYGKFVYFVKLSCFH